MPIKSKFQEEGPVNQSRSERERDGVGGEEQEAYSIFYSKPLKEKINTLN